MPLLILRAFIKPDDGTKMLNEEMESSEITINPIINKLFLCFCRLENKIKFLIPQMPGGSIILVAEKKL